MRRALWLLAGLEIAYLALGNFWLWRSVRSRSWTGPLGVVRIGSAYTVVPGCVQLRDVELVSTGRLRSARVLARTVGACLGWSSLFTRRWQLGEVNAGGVHLFLRDEQARAARADAQPHWPASTQQRAARAPPEEADGIVAGPLPALPLLVLSGARAPAIRRERLVIDRLDLGIDELWLFEYRALGAMHLRGRVVRGTDGAVGLASVELRCQDGSLSFGANARLLESVALGLEGSWPALPPSGGLADAHFTATARARVVALEALGAYAENEWALANGGGTGELRASLEWQAGRVLPGSRLDLRTPPIAWRRGPLVVSGVLEAQGLISDSDPPRLSLLLSGNDLELRATNPGIPAAYARKLALEVVKEDNDLGRSGAWKSHLSLEPLELPDLSWLNAFAGETDDWRLRGGRGKIGVDARWSSGRPSTLRLEADFLAAAWTLGELELVTDGQLRARGRAPTGAWSKSALFEAVTLELAHSRLTSASGSSRPFSTHFESSRFSYENVPPLGWSADYEARLETAEPILVALGAEHRVGAAAMSLLHDRELRLTGRLWHTRHFWDVTVDRGSCGEASVSGRWQRRHRNGRAVFVVGSPPNAFGVELEGTSIQLEPTATSAWLRERFESFGSAHP